MKKIIIFCILISFVSHSQTDTAKNVIIINTDIRQIINKKPKIKINDITTPKIGYKKFVIQQHHTDSITIKIPYYTLFFKKKEKIFRFAIKEKNNYFKFTHYSGLMMTKPHIKQIKGKKLIRIKKKGYIRKKIAEFHLEE